MIPDVPLHDGGSNTRAEMVQLQGCGHCLGKACALGCLGTACDPCTHFLYACLLLLRSCAMCNTRVGSGSALAVACLVPANAV